MSLAKECREVAENINNKLGIDNAEIYSEVVEAIKEAAGKGRFSCEYNIPSGKNAVKAVEAILDSLEKDEFVVNTNSWGGSTSLMIEW